MARGRHARPPTTRRGSKRARGDQELARHFAIVREEMAKPSTSTRRWVAVPAHARQAASRIDADPARTSRTMFGAGIGRLFAALSPQVLAWSTAIAALVIVLQAGVIATMLTGERAGPRRATFETASAPEAMPSPAPAPMTRSLAPAAAPAPAARGAGPHVLVRFAPKPVWPTSHGFWRPTRRAWKMDRAGRALSAAGERRR